MTILGIVVVVAVVLAIVLAKVIPAHRIKSEMKQTGYKTCEDVISAINNREFSQAKGVEIMDYLAQQSKDSETKVACYSYIRDSYYLYKDDSNKSKDLKKALKYGLLAQKYSSDGEAADALSEIYSQLGKKEEAKKYYNIANERGYYDEEDQSEE